MFLLPGYWQTNYWSKSYWNKLYWPHCIIAIIKRACILEFHSYLGLFIRECSLLENEIEKHSSIVTVMNKASLKKTKGKRLHG